MIKLFICCGLFLACCSTSKKEYSLIGTWQLVYVKDEGISAEEENGYRVYLASGGYFDELFIPNDSVVIHRFRKAREKWNEIKNCYTLSADKKKITVFDSLNTHGVSIILLTADSLKIQLPNKDVNAYSRKN